MTLPQLGLMFASTIWNTPDDIRNAVEVCEESGVESVWAVEHVLTPMQLKSPYPYNETGEMPGLKDVVLCDPMVWLSFVAAISTRLRLATGILILPQRHPAYVAKEWSTLDRLSNGRAILGVGVGWLEEEMEAVDVSFARRGARMDESIDAIRSLWTDWPSSANGSFFNWDEMVSNPQPPTPRSIPIVVGGHSATAARRAARRGDGYFFPGSLSSEINSGGDAGALAKMLDVIKQECEEIGRDPAEIEITVGASGGTQESIEELAALGVHRVVIGAPAADKLERRLGNFEWLLSALRLERA